MSKKYPGGYLTKTPPTVSQTSAQGIWTLEQAEYYQQAGQWPVAPDPYFNQVSLLLHGDGTNGAQNNTFLDSSTNNFTITRYGNVAQGTFSPFSLAEGQWSNYFDGSGDYLSVADSLALRVCGSSFTIECWFYLTSAVSNLGLVSKYDAGGAGYIFRLDTTGLIYYENQGTVWATASQSFQTNTWYHVAVTSNGSSGAVYINGVRGATFTPTAGNSTAALQIGRTNTAANDFPGYISNVRIVKGTAVYDPSQSTLTVPTSALTAITNTSLLTCQSNRFVDNSANNFTITPYGDTKVTAFSPFAPSAAYSASTNGGSGYFDGSGDYLALANNTALSFGTGDFTVEAWVNTTTKTNYQSICSSYGSTSQTGFFLLLNSSGFVVAGVNATTYITGTINVCNGAWNHIAYTRASGVTKIWVNGVLNGTLTSTDAANSTDGLYIGSQPGTYITRYFNGFISNPRVVKGTAVYTTNFTPPTAPLTAITNTSLLLNCTNAGIFDNAGKNDIETVGDAQISTSVKKYGTGSMSFNGTNSSLTTPYVPTLNFGTANFTIEGWFYFNSVASGQQLVSGYTTGTNLNYAFYTSSTGNVAYYLSSTGNSWNIASNVSMGSVSINTWYHIALVRNGSTFTPYVNGIAGTTSSSSAAIYNGLVPVTIGATAGSYFFNGYIDDFRITNGVARYTANFTPPTQAFPNV